MKEVAIEEKIRLMEKEMELLGESIESIKMDLNEQVAMLGIELNTLKAYLTKQHPDFKTEYLKIKKMVTSEVDPDRMK
jgi:hypothetical protein